MSTTKVTIRGARIAAPGELGAASNGNTTVTVADPAAREKVRVRLAEERAERAERELAKIRNLIESATEGADGLVLDGPALDAVLRKGAETLEDNRRLRDAAEALAERVAQLEGTFDELHGKLRQAEADRDFLRGRVRELEAAGPIAVPAAPPAGDGA